MSEISISSDGPQPSKAIRKCNANDVEMIVGMAKRFIAYSPYSAVPLDDAHLRGLFDNLITNGVILTNETGFICGIITPLFFAPQVLVAAEMAWWSEGGAGQELKTAFEGWARERGASAVQFSAFNNQFAPSMNEMLTKDGYHPIEVGYLKALV